MREQFLTSTGPSSGELAHALCVRGKIQGSCHVLSLYLLRLKEDLVVLATENLLLVCAEVTQTCLINIF